MKFLPLTVAYIYPGLFQKAEASISDMTKANYFYLTSYPIYSGYRIDQDPTLTVYLASEQTSPTASSTTPSTSHQRNSGVLIAIIIAVLIIAIAVVAIVLRKKPKTNT
jgi:hypothetical protein